jgi:alpha-ketoglutarate-dependent taurine dioxygenase
MLGDSDGRAASGLALSRVAGHIGADVDGADLSQPLLPSVVAEIWSGLLRHKVLFFRGQRLGHREQVALARQFGELTRRLPPHAGPSPEGFPEILTIDAKEADQRFGVDFEEHYRKRWLTYGAGWHTDLTPAVNPPAACILRAEACPSFGGETTWTNLAAAYDGLSSPLKVFVSSLRAEHSFFAGCQMLPHDPVDQHVLAMNKAHPLVSVHPVVRVHPETGEKALFVNPASTRRIVGMRPAESRHVLAMLFDQVVRPDYTVRLRWSPGTVAFWDNRSTAHLQAVDVGHVDGRRTLYRATLLGDRPVGPDGFVSQAVAGEPFAALPG